MSAPELLPVSADNSDETDRNPEGTYGKLRHMIEDLLSTDALQAIVLDRSDPRFLIARNRS